MNTNDKHQYVDLGLSVNWATCNVDAERPEEDGGFYAWGEIKTKRNYSWLKYKFGKLRFIYGFQISKYAGGDLKTILDPSDDVANVKWGENWRMPTAEEFEELRKNCTWIWTDINGIKGYKVFSNKSGYSDRYIFLPASGYRSGRIWNKAGDEGGYWSSSVNSSPLFDRAFYLHFDKEGGHSRHCRNAGLTVRPVFPSNSWNVKIKERSLTIKENDIYKLNIEDSDNNIIDWFKIKWSSDNSYVALVDDYGRVTGISVGSAIIKAMVKNRVVYCNVEVVDTKQGKRNIPNYVDLGLSVKWAICNLGGSAPEAFGNYYSWGELRTKTLYSVVNYKYRKTGYASEDIKYYKYNNSDQKDILDLSDDVANKEWGGAWRIPTLAEWEELRRQCKWEPYTLNGINGYVVTSKKKGYTDRSIFLPESGYYKENTLIKANNEGRYWSSTLFKATSSQNMAESFYLNDDFCSDAIEERHFGLSIRPVRQ